MKKLLIIFACSLLLTNCKRNHYYCNCKDANSSYYYQKDYGTYFSTKESDLKKECDSHKINASTSCQLYAE